MTQFEFTRPEVKVGKVHERADVDEVRYEVPYHETPDGVACVDCGKEFTNIMGFRLRPKEGKLQTLQFHYRETECGRNYD